MKTNFSSKKICPNGFSLVEILLSISLLLLIITAVIGSIIYSQGSVVLSGNRTRAAALAEEGIEAVKNIKQNSFLNLENGEYGLAVEDGHWILADAEDTIDIFKRKINITTASDETKQITSTVNWESSIGQNNLVVLSTYMTDWTVPYVPLIDFFEVDFSGANLYKPAYDILEGIILKNKSENRSIKITKMKIDWIPTNQNIQGITIGDTLVWSENGPGSPQASQPTGALIDIQDFTLLAQSEQELKLDFTGNMKTAIFEITFYISDGSQKTTSGIGPF